MKKKLLSFVFLLLFVILLQNQCFAKTVSGYNRYYQLELPDDYGGGPRMFSRIGDVASWYSDSNYEGTVEIHSYEKSSQYGKYDPELNDNGIYCLNGYSLGDLNKAIESQNTFLTQYNNVSDLHKELLTLNNCPAQRVNYKTEDNDYIDIYTVESDNYIAWISFKYCKKSFINSQVQKNIINSFKFTKGTANKVMNLPFEDVLTTDWYNQAVRYTYKNKIMSGCSNTTFKPNEKLTRGMLVSILYKMEGQPKVTGKSNFLDVQNSKDYYYTAVVWASNNKIVSGYNNRNFGANDNITREDLAVILNKYAKYKGKNTSQTNNLNAFSDKDKVSRYALPQMQWAAATGVITGSKGKLNPRGNATRAEAAAMIEKYCNKVGR